MKKHKRKLQTFLIALLIIVSAFTAYQYYKAKTYGVHFKQQEYPIRAVMEYHEKLGITGNRSLDFPRIPIGTVVTRDMELANFYGFPIRIVPSATGNVSEYIISSLEPIYLEIDETQNFNVSIEGRGPPGNYTGTLILDLYKLI